MIKSLSFLGNWYVDSHEDTKELVIRQKLSDEEYHPIVANCGVDSTFPKMRQELHAKLISAAPELDAALRLCVYALAHHENEKERQAALKIAKIAINKASFEGILDGN